MRVALGLVLVGAWLAGCGGPRPVVEHVDARPLGDGRVRVAVTVRNASGGNGQASLSVTLRDRATGGVVARQEQTVELQPRERVTVALDLVAAGAPADVTAEAEAQPPPRLTRAVLRPGAR